ncbi:hypothetical protein BPOR_0487g00110 [Botrytis porri]|uniref:Uncharacterized protein n=1 Tax=Botrytis porri TaxID=87229 RepID=A0A4Z1KRI2_9HELO|nr:hypothetical protein BPOR_0487g00110 [Botrytis porri]
MDRSLLDASIQDMKKFLSKEERYDYIERGRRYKCVYLLHGFPGCGKTPFIELIASIFQVGLYSLDMSNETSVQMRDLLSAIPKRSLFVIEDLRTSTFQKSEEEDPESHEKLTKGVPVASFLNMLDGFVAPEEIITITTTTCLKDLEKYCKDLLRPGRIDRKIKLGYIASSGAAMMFENFTRSKDLDMAERFGREIPKDSITPADLQEYLTPMVNNPNLAIEGISDWGSSREVSAKEKIPGSNLVNQGGKRKKKRNKRQRTLGMKTLCLKLYYFHHSITIEESLKEAFQP